MGRKLFLFSGLLALLSIFLNFLIAPKASSRSQVTVFAASSLTESFTELAKRFEKSNPDVKVTLAFQASSTLATQIKAGAPADIFVSAGIKDMKGIAKGRDYLNNRVVLAVAKDSKISSFSDLDNGVIWIQCAIEVPCGAAAQRALQSENINTKPASLEPKATSVVAKLLSGEVDAAIIYRTDVIANRDKLKMIEFKDRASASTIYQIAQLRNNRMASNFMTYLNLRSSIKYLQSKGFSIDE